MKEKIKTIFISITVYFGAAFAIMSFNEDVAVGELFERIYKIFHVNSDNKVIEWGYIIGISSGIIIFFNNFGRNNKEEPTPIELKAYEYESSVKEFKEGKNIENNNGSKDVEKCQ